MTQHNRHLVRWLAPLLALVSVLLPGRAARAQCDGDNDLYVAVAISGGGFRAAAFGHGILEGLRRVDLPPGVLPHAKSRSILDNVNVVSAVSGGSIAAAYWASGRPPDQFGSLIAHTNIVGELHQRVLDRAWKDLAVSHVILPWTDSPFKKLLTWRGLATSKMVEDVFSTFIPPGLTFGQTSKLKINTLNLSGMRTFVFPDDLPCAGLEPEGFRVLPAVVASSSLPGVFEPYDLQANPAHLSDSKRNGTIPPRCARRVSEKVADHLLADGGLVDNLGLSEIIREVTARKRTANGRGLRAIVILVNANIDSSPDRTPADGKDIVAASFDRMIQDRTRDSIDAVRDYLSLYGVELLEFNVADLKQSLSEAYHPQVDNWTLGADVPEELVDQVIVAAAHRVMTRKSEIYDALDRVCSEHVSSNQPGPDGLPSPLDDGNFFEWRPDWSVNDDFIMSTIATDAYKHGKDLVDAQRKYISRQARLEADLAAQTQLVDTLAKSKAQAEKDRDDHEAAMKQLEAEKEKILQDKVTSETAAKARIDELNKLTQELAQGIAASNQHIDALTRQVADANASLNVLRETRASIAESPPPEKPKPEEKEVPKDEEHPKARTGRKTAATVDRTATASVRRN